MKVFNTILKILAILAAIAGIVYVIATYGDKLTAWAKSLLCKLNCCCCDCDCCDEEVEVVEAPAEETACDQDFEG